MYAEVGDLLVIRPAQVGGPERVGEILFVRRADGGPPYLVCWSDTGRQSLVYPGAAAVVVPRAAVHDTARDMSGQAPQDPRPRVRSSARRAPQ